MKMTLSEFMDHLSTVENVGTQCGFDMDRTAQYRESDHHPCGTACCIGGHAALLLGRHLAAPEQALHELVGISLNDAKLICWGGDTDNPALFHATLPEALRLLEVYSSTGEVRWNEVLEIEE